MINTISSGVLTLSLLLCASLAQAQVDTATADKLMYGAALTQKIIAVMPQMQAVVADSAGKPGSNLKRSQLPAARQTISEAFAPERMWLQARGIVALKVSPENVPTLMAWYNSPTGRKVTELEQADAGRDPTKPRTEGTAQLKTMNANRRTTLQQLAKVKRAAETAVDAVAAAGPAILEGESSARSALLAQKTRQLLEVQRPELLAAWESNELGDFALIYAALTDNQLAEYLEFSKTPQGRQMSDVCMLAHSETLAAAAKEWGKQLQLASSRPSPEPLK